MPTISLEYQGELRTVLTHLHSGTKIFTDAPVDNHGKGESFSPTDLVSGALAACMVTVMGIKARALGFDPAGIRVSVTKKMSSAPRKIGEIEIKMTLPELNLSEEIKQILIKEAHNCPVALSLHPDLVQNVSFVFEGYSGNQELLDS